jgi:hypothetical protein
MLRFNTGFLLQATAVTALACLPMAFNRESGFVTSAFLLPASLAFLAACHVERHGEFVFKLRQLSKSVVEIRSTGGPQSQRSAQGRILATGICLSLVCGFPMLHQVDPEPPERWLPLVAAFAVLGVANASGSTRRVVLTEERQFVTDYLLFGRLCVWRRRWQVREGDSLVVLIRSMKDNGGTPEFAYWHALFVCRSRRRYLIASIQSNARVVPGLESAARRVADLVDLPYEGYREAKGL